MNRAASITDPNSVPHRHEIVRLLIDNGATLDEDNARRLAKDADDHTTLLRVNNLSYSDMVEPMLRKTEGTLGIRRTRGE